MSGPRVLVIDDDEKITTSLRRALAYAGYSTEIAHDGVEGLSAARDSWPDLVILDILLPGMNGLEVCRRLREGGDVPIIMLTAKDDISDRVAGLDMGADDYLVKPFAVDELLARVRALLRRREPKDQQVLRFADLTLDAASREVMRGERSIELSAKEYDLLLLFMRHPRQVLTRDLIFERVWGYDFGGESNVLDVYIGYLRNKLEAGSEKRLIHTIRGAGYVLRE
ncbi:MAG: response regulator transcription factor [Chloroflexota bacterium]|nr:MAG: response regulator transcription factor [Chloroflexota bacterium]